MQVDRLTARLLVERERPRTSDPENTLTPSLSTTPLSPGPSRSKDEQGFFPRVEEGAFPFAFPVAPGLAWEERHARSQQPTPFAPLHPSTDCSPFLCCSSTLRRALVGNQFMDKRISILVQGGRKVTGVLRGFDIFLNLVVDDAFDESVPAEKSSIGMVVSLLLFALCFAGCCGRVVRASRRAEEGRGGGWVGSSVGMGQATLLAWTRSLAWA